ncbi:MAG: hypothetical protein AAF629_20865 [Chloroflexota bacterium]
MKQFFFGLIAITTTTCAIWVVYGGIVVTIIFVTLAITTLLISAFGLGSWWSTRLIQQGATIALQAQSSDDQRDITQIKALASLVKETLRFQQPAPSQQTYPLLKLETERVGAIEAIDADFTIAGLDEPM